MQLYLGDGASEYSPLIELAVEKWNGALLGFSQRPVISIVEGRSPTNYSLPEGFWSQSESIARDLRTDGQSVIYFAADDVEGAPGGFAWQRLNDRGQVVEADMYINITDEVEYGSNLALTHEIIPGDDTLGMYGFMNRTFKVILHEIGHALGLAHVPIAGNVMSYNYPQVMEEVWQGPYFSTLIVTGMLVALAGEQLELQFFEGSGMAQRHDEMHPYMVLESDELINLMNIHTTTAQIGDQDKMALMCVYDFTDWNH